MVVVVVLLQQLHQLHQLHQLAAAASAASAALKKSRRDLLASRHSYTPSPARSRGPGGVGPNQLEPIWLRIGCVGVGWGGVGCQWFCSCGGAVAMVVVLWLLWCGSGIVLVVVVWQWYCGCGVAIVL